jgi:hypothetical protein
MGLTDLLPDYVVETNFSTVDDNKTKMEISHYYSSSHSYRRLLAIRRANKIGLELKRI